LARQQIIWPSIDQTEREFQGLSAGCSLFSVPRIRMFFFIQL